MFTLRDHTSDRVFDFKIDFHVRMCIVCCSAPRPVPDIRIHSPVIGQMFEAAPRRGCDAFIRDMFGIHSKTFTTH